MNFKQRVHSLFFEGIDPIHLDVYRRCLTIAFLVYMTYLFTHASEWLTDDGFHVTLETQLRHAAKPWPTLPSSMVPVFAMVLYGAGICLIVGRFTRPALWIALVCAIYVQRVDSLTAFAMNKLVILGFAIMALAPPPREVKLANGQTAVLQSAWPVRILQATLMIIYFTSAVSKGFLGDWLSHSDVVWTVIQGTFRTDLSALLLRMLPKWCFTLPMIFVLAFEFLAPVLLGDKRLRPWGVAAGVLLHVGLASMMSTVFFFSLLMITYYVLFLPASTLHQVQKWYTPARANASASHTANSTQLTQIRSIAFDEGKSDAQKIESIQSVLGASDDT